MDFLGPAVPVSPHVGLWCEIDERVAEVPRELVAEGKVQEVVGVVVRPRVDSTRLWKSNICFGNFSPRPNKSKSPQINKKTIRLNKYLGFVVFSKL